jgi:hypothetical protein
MRENLLVGLLAAAWGAAVAAEPGPAGPVKVGPPKIVDYTDPTYGARIRQLRKDDGHEHNLYYYRDPTSLPAALGFAAYDGDWHEILTSSPGDRTS